jgi:hypothetical protein
MVRRVLLSVLLCSACHDPLEAELYGHRAVVVEQGRRIAVFDRDQRPVIRAPGPHRSFQVTFGKLELDSDTSHEDGADFIRVRSATIAPSDAELVVRASTGERASFPIRWSVRPEDRPEIQPIVEARMRGDFAGAMALAERAAASDDRMVRVLAATERGRIALRRGDPLEAARFWREAADVARTEGVITEVAARLSSGAYAANLARRFGLAQELMHLAEAAAVESGDLLAHQSNSEINAQIAGYLGDHRRARTEAENVVRIARRLGSITTLLNGEGMLATYYSDVGRFQDAIARYPDPESPELTAEGRARMYVNLGWTELHGIRAGALDQSFDDPRRHLERGIALYRPLHQPYRLANALCTLAEVELADDRIDRAEELVREARRVHSPIFDEDAHNCAFDEIEIHLRRGRIDKAALLLTALEPRVRDGIFDESAMLPLACAARIARAQGRSDALALYQRAFDDMVARARQTPIQADRAQYIAGRTSIVDELIDLALERGDIAGAWSIADAARALVLSELDADTRLSRLEEGTKLEWTKRLERWHALRDELPKREAECDRMPSAKVAHCRSEIDHRRQEIAHALDHAFEVLDREAPALNVTRIVAADVQRALGENAGLVLVHGTGDAMRSFWMDKSVVRVERGPPPLDRWLTPTIDVLHVIGRWDPIESATDQMAASVAIVLVPSARWMLDPPSIPEDEALIAADPKGDLPGSRQEVEQLGVRGKLLVGKAASRRALLDAIDGARLFHFAGHARVIGASPWDTQLEAADGALTLEDLLVERPRVGLVVLSACASAGRTAKGELGLPHAFLLAGARAVIATTRPLGDHEGRAFVVRFYQSGGLDQPIRAFRAAVAASITARDPSWRAFRLFGR